MPTVPMQGAEPSATTGEPVAVGVDIGGRHVRVGAVTPAGRVVAARAADTPAHRPARPTVLLRRQRLLGGPRVRHRDRAQRAGDPDPPSVLGAE